MSQQQTNTHTQQQEPINELQHLPRNRPAQPANPFQEQSQRLNTCADPGRGHSSGIRIDQHQHKPTELRIN